MGNVLNTTTRIFVSLTTTIYKQKLIYDRLDNDDGELVWPRRNSATTRSKYAHPVEFRRRAYDRDPCGRPNLLPNLRNCASDDVPTRTPQTKIRRRRRPLIRTGFAITYFREHQLLLMASGGSGTTCGIHRGVFKDGGGRRKEALNSECQKGRRHWRTNCFQSKMF